MPGLRQELSTLKADLAFLAACCGDACPLLGELAPGGAVDGLSGPGPPRDSAATGLASSPTAAGGGDGRREYRACALLDGASLLAVVRGGLAGPVRLCRGGLAAPAPK